MASSPGDHVAAADNGTPITYRYLQFETALPAPAKPAAASTTGSPPDIPACPDLSAYSDPFSWSPARKNLMLFISCVATMLTAYSAGAYSPAVEAITVELNTTRLPAVVGITTFCIGFALAPMALAPLSETYGRYPIFAVSGVFFTLFQAICGVVPGLAGMLIARFIAGAGGSVFSTMVGGVIADLYKKEDRNIPMALFSASVMFGTGLGPFIASVISYRWSDEGEKWKWVFWHQVIVDFALTIAVVTGMSETRGTALLSKRAAKLNEWYEELESKGVWDVWVQDENEGQGGSGETSDDTAVDEEQKIEGPQDGSRVERIRWRVKADEERASIPVLVKTALIRPFQFLFTESIVFFFSLWVAFAWAILYLMFGSIPVVMKRQYGFNQEQSGYVFAAMMVGAVIGGALGIYTEKLSRHPEWQARDEMDKASASSSPFWTFIRQTFPVESPESRLYFTCIMSLFLPAGLYLFGFSAQPDIHWIVPAIAVCLSTIGVMFVYLATFNYFADTYQMYASSALAAQSFCRNILGGAFPLASMALWTNLGEDAAGGLLGGIATVLAPVPWVLVFFGNEIRSRSKFAVALGN